MNNMFVLSGNGRTIFKFGFGDEMPTITGVGLTLDRAGYLYGGIYNGSSVYKIDPRLVFRIDPSNESDVHPKFYLFFRTSKLLKVINLPTEIITSVAFGGPKMDVLFVLSSTFPLSIHTGLSTNETLSSTAGSLFMVRGLRARGFEPRKFCF